MNSMYNPDNNLTSLNSIYAINCDKYQKQIGNTIQNPHGITTNTYLTCMRKQSIVQTPSSSTETSTESSDHEGSSQIKYEEMDDDAHEDRSQNKCKEIDDNDEYSPQLKLPKIEDLQPILNYLEDNNKYYKLKYKPQSPGYAPVNIPESIPSTSTDENKDDKLKDSQPILNYLDDEYNPQSPPQSPGYSPVSPPKPVILSLKSEDENLDDEYNPQFPPQSPGYSPVTPPKPMNPSTKTEDEEKDGFLFNMKIDAIRHLTTLHEVLSKAEINNVYITYLDKVLSQSEALKDNTMYTQSIETNNNYFASVIREIIRDTQEQIKKLGKLPLKLHKVEIGDPSNKIVEICDCGCKTTLQICECGCESPFTSPHEFKYPNK